MTRISGCSTRRHPTSTLRQARGFTLLEILLVLTIMGMASVIIFPNLGSLESRSFSAQVRQASSLLNYARRMAVVTGQPSEATFVIGLVDSQASLSPVRQNNVGRWRSEGTAVIYRDSTGQELEVEDEISITFYPEGGSTGGEMQLFQGDQQVNIHVDPFTGRVSTEYVEE